MNFKNKLTLIVILLLNISLFAQNSFVVKGTVVSGNDNGPLPGVSIIIQGTTSGVTTDFDGNFQLEVTNGDVLQISFMGFQTQFITITNQTQLNIVLAEDTSQLDEVVVIGYGSQKKSHLTGAISKVVNDDLDQIATARADDALVGQVAGVNIQATDGEAGAPPTIRIRGTGSITGDSGPLVVIDGVAVDSEFLGSIDMNDVASFEVLKDAASAAIFGSRGGNGVIMITTKEGKEGKTKFTYNTYFGIKEARHSDGYTLPTANEWAAMELDATGVISDQTLYKQLLSEHTYTNWQDVIFDGGNIVSHSLSARGGSAKTKFSTSLNYMHDEGVLLTDDYKKYGLKLKLDHKANEKLSFGVSINPTYTERRRFDGSVHDILRQPSWLPVYVDDWSFNYVNPWTRSGQYAGTQIGDYAQQRMFSDFDWANGVPSTGGGLDIDNTSNTNPYAKVAERDRRDKAFKVLGSLYGSYNITEDLNFRTSFSGTYQGTHRYRWQGVLSNRNGASAASLGDLNQRVIKLVSDNYLSYSKVFDKHEINAVLGTSAERTKSYFSTVTGTGYDSDLVQSISNATLISGASSFEWEKRLLSFFARVNYAYDDKYLGSVSLRRDGSSIFGLDNKYGNFVAASAGWNIHSEDFLADSDVVNLLKLRVSYGVTGNDRLNSGNFNINVTTSGMNYSTGDVLIDNYPYIALLQASTAVTEGGATGAFNPINIANPELKWERSVEINPGIDFGLFNGIVSGSLDYYVRTSDQLLLFNPISVTTGFKNALVNIGEVENKGYELEVRTRNVSNEAFTWRTTLLASQNENTLTDFADSNGQIQSVDSKRAAEWINLEGNPISSFYGWVVDKDIPLEYITNPWHPIGAQAQDVYVKDLNGDGLIDDEDKAILGNPYPDLIWSVTNEFKIGNFDLSFMFQGSHGAEVRNMADQYIFNQFNSRQDFNTATTPDQQFIKNKIFTNDIIMDASYVALRNVNLGYTLPRDLLSRYAISKARIYLTGQNLMYLTADDYTGWNPESIDKTSSTTYGYQRGGSPIYSTITVGLNLEF